MIFTQNKISVSLNSILKELSIHRFVEYFGTNHSKEIFHSDVVVVIVFVVVVIFAAVIIVAAVAIVVVVVIVVARFQNNELMNDALPR